MSLYSAVDTLITKEINGVYYFRAGEQLGELQQKLAIQFRRKYSYTECITAGFNSICMQAGLYAKRHSARLVIGVGQIYGYKFGSSVIVRNYETTRCCSQNEDEKYADFIDRAVSVLVRNTTLNFIVFASCMDANGLERQWFCDIPTQ